MEIYELTYRINGESNRPILRRGSRAELQAVISDALHYDLDYLSLVAERAFTPVPETSEKDWLDEAAENAFPTKSIEVKQAPINTANHKCRFCGKSIREVENGLEESHWVHQHSELSGCWLYNGDSSTYAEPAGE